MRNIDKLLELFIKNLHLIFDEKNNIYRVTGQLCPRRSDRKQRYRRSDNFG